MGKVLIIIPAYNEEDNIKETCKSIDTYNKKSKNKYDYIVINDGSTDSTESVLIENKISHITLVNNLGIGGAIQTGYKYAYQKGYDIAVQFDGDGQHDINYVEKIIKPIEESGANLVIGSRYIENTEGFKSTKLRRTGIKIISFFIKLFTKKRIYDTTSGFRAVDRSSMQYFSKNYPIEYPEPISNFELLKMNKKVVEVAVEMKERIGGTSSIRSWKNLYYMMNVILSIIALGMRRYK